jgi:hypothetical protein
MELLVNDLSMHGQFSDLETFRSAIAAVMKTRMVARRYGRELNCHRGLSSAQVMATKNMQQAASSLSRDEQRALMQWLTQHGPFWEDQRVHEAHDWLECNGAIVTDRALGEAALCRSRGVDRRLVSFSPSQWEFSPIPVVYVVDQDRRETVEVVNYWDADAVELDLRTAAPPLTSWRELASVARLRFAAITLSDHAFTPLHGEPFIRGAAERILVLLQLLDRLVRCFDTDGQRTTEGHEIYQNFFTGKKEGGGRGAAFSDSSDDEKARFARELTFSHPADSSKKLVCPWHGKIQTPQLRIHFSWPVRANEPLYVVYIGPKITKR